jgi:hypothetical protein
VDGERLLLGVTVLVLGAWTLATVAHGAGLPVERVIRSETLLRFVPQWNFFAPTPGVHDYHLFYRDQLASGDVGPWREAGTFARPRRLVDAIWNPDGRAVKAWLDLVPTLSLEAYALRDRPDAVQLTLPYLLLVNYAAHLPGSALSVARQVMITRAAPDTEPEVVFVSRLHGL